MSDKHVDAVVKRHQDRAAHGLAKYGTTLERNDLTVLQWLQHAQDEAMDFAVYLERLKELAGDLDLARQAIQQRERADKLDAAMCDKIKRTVKVEVEMQTMAKINQPVGAEQLRDWARQLSGVTNA